MASIAPMHSVERGEVTGDSGPAQEPGQFLAEHLSQWSGMPRAEVSRAVLACRHCWATLEHLVQFRADPAMPAMQLDKLDKRAGKERQKAVRRLEPIVEAGLLAREGKQILSDEAAAEHSPHGPADWLAWQAIELCLSTLSVEVSGLSVCRSCTLIFRPHGRRALFCPACATRAREPVVSPVSAAGEIAQLRARAA
jgi:hypothetical protein